MAPGQPCPCAGSDLSVTWRWAWLALPLGGARLAPPRGDTWRLGCQPLRTTRPASHVARPGTWAAMPMRLYQDLIVIGRCQDPIRLGRAPGPNGNGLCVGPNAIDPT